jgi:putative membrane protein (TIGR04086 family)
MNVGTGGKIKGVVKGLIVAYLLAVLLLFILAVIVYRVEVSDTILSIALVVIYGLSTFVGGVITGKAVEEKRFVWGMVFGLLYASLITLVAQIMGGDAGTPGKSELVRCLMCIASGMLGAMLS